MKENDKISCNCFKWSGEGFVCVCECVCVCVCVCVLGGMVGEIYPMYSVRLFGIVTTNLPGTMNVS
jgi:hypothetical protein